MGWSLEGARMRKLVSVTTCLAMAVATVGLAIATATVAEAAVTAKKINVNAQPVAVSVINPGDDGSASFSGLVGQTVTVTTSAGTFASNCDVLVSLRNSLSVDLTTPVCGGQTVTLPAVALTKNSTYTVFLDVQGVVTGSVKVAVAATGPNSLTPGAPKITLSIPGNSTVDWGFQLATGSFIYAEFGAASPAVGCSGQASFLNPASATILGTVCMGTGVALDRAVTTTTGVHKLRIVNSGATAFTVPVTLVAAKDLVGTITPGTPATWKIAAKGQSAKYSFTGAVGQRPILSLSGSTYPAAGVLVSLVNPSGTTVEVQSFTTATAWLEFAPLTAAGSWALLVDPSGGGTGTASATLNLVTDQSGTITPGTTKSVTVSTKGQNANLTFSGTAGQTATLNVTGSTLSSSIVTLVRPNGTTLISNGFGTGASFLDFTSSPLDAAGTWTLTVDPQGQATGSATLTLTLTNGGGGGGTITPGTPVTTTINTAGGTKSYTFGGTAGQRPTLFIGTADWRSAINGGGVGSGTAYVYLYRPDGSYFGYFTGTSTGNVYGETSTLDVNGTWKITVDPIDDSVGSQTMTLGLVTDQTGTITPGTVKSVSIGSKGQNSFYSFSGTAGQRATFAISAMSWASAVGGGAAGSGSAYVSLYRPDGSYFSGLTGGSTGTAYGETSSPLDATGTWTVQVDPSGDSVGSLTGTLGLVIDQTGSITPGTAKSVSVASEGQNAIYSFTGTAGQRATFSISAMSWASAVSGGAAGSGNAYVYIYRPDGSYFGYLTGGSTGTAYGEVGPLDATGTWTIQVDPNYDSVGSLTGTLGLVTDQMGTITLGTPKTVTIASKGQNAKYSFTGTLNKVVAYNVTGSTYASGAINLYRPDGTSYSSVGFGPGASSGSFVALDVAGTWTVEVDPYADSTGTMGLTLS